MLCVLPPQTGTRQIRNVAGIADMSGNNFLFIWKVGVGFISIFHNIRIPFCLPLARTRQRRADPRDEPREGSRDEKTFFSAQRRKSRKNR